MAKSSGILSPEEFEKIEPLLEGDDLVNEYRGGYKRVIRREIESDPETCDCDPDAKQVVPANKTKGRGLTIPGIGSLTGTTGEDEIVVVCKECLSAYVLEKERVE